MEEDPECVALKNETLTKVNKCFETEPQNPLCGLEDLFVPPGMKKRAMMMMKQLGKGGHSGGKSGEKGVAGTAAEKPKSKRSPKSEGKSGQKSKAKTEGAKTEGEKGNTTAPDSGSSEEDDDKVMEKMMPDFSEWPM